MPNLVKTLMRSVMAQSFVDSVNNSAARYFYVFGKTDPWANDAAPDTPIDHFQEVLTARSNMIYAKQIQPSEVSLIVKRINWTTGTVYDNYDDRYSTEVIGVNLISGGSGYTSAPTVTITGSGTGATATATINASTGKVTSIDIVSRGSGYVNSASNPLTVTLAGGGGTGAWAAGVISLAQGNVAKIEDAQFYVYTDEFNIYVCLDNNNDAPSTVKPFGTSTIPFQTNDGYIWKYVYTVPLALRERFLTPSWVPVNTSLKQGFVSGGSIAAMQVNAPGSGYTAYTQITISGDGFLSSNPYFLTGSSIATPGVGYTAATLTIDPPVGGSLASTAWAANRSYIVGQYVSNGSNIYQVTVAGTSTTAPTTTAVGGTQVLGATYKFVGRAATATATVTAGAVTAVAFTNQGVRGVTITNGGTGYPNGPNTVTFSTGGATGVAFAQNGVIYRIDITNPGFNYSSVPTITSIAGGGTGFAGTVLMQNGYGYTTTPTIAVTGTGSITTPAVVTATMTKSDALVYPVISGGAITGYTIVDGGVGYTTATATVTGNGTGADVSANTFIGDVTTLQSSIELTAVDGAIHNIQVVSGGYGYTTAPTVIVEGDGTGAQASATIFNGAINKFIVTNIGSGYRWAKIRIIGDGTGASGRAIVPPPGGHGSNILRSLYARNIMVTSYLSKDKVQSLNLACDYRQFGIIRNPMKFTGGTPLISSTASACYSITGSGNIPVDFSTVDSIVQMVPLTNAVSQSIGSVSNSTTLVMASATGLKVGMGIFGAGISAGTTITSISGTTVTISLPGSGLAAAQVLKFNYLASFRVILYSAARIVLQSITNTTPAVGDTMTCGTGNFTVATVTAPEIDKYSGDFLYLNNRTPFTPLDGSSQKITVSTVLKF